MASRVGLLLMVDLPELGGLHAVLQVRGTFNPETMGPESYPGGCQITCAGKVEQGETSIDALAREMWEELGLHLYEMHRAFMMLGAPDLEVAAIFNPDARILQLLRLHPGTGGLRLIRSNTPIIDLKGFSKTDGVRDRNVIAMFSDEAEIVGKVFKIFSYSPA